MAEVSELTLTDTAGDKGKPSLRSGALTPAHRLLATSHYPLWSDYRRKLISKKSLS